MCDLDEMSKYFMILQNQHSHNIGEIEQAFSYTISNFMKIRSDYRLYSLDKTTFEKILVSDFLDATSEEVVFDSMKEYLGHNLLNPEEHLYDLLHVVRLPLVSTKYLMNEVEPLVNSVTLARPLFLEALRFHFFPKERHQISEYKMKPRKPKKCAPEEDLSPLKNDMILLIGNTGDMSGILEVYSRSRNEWEIYKNFQLTVRNFSVAAIENRLMLIGGFTIPRGGPVNTVYSIDLKTGTLSNESPLNESKFNTGVAVIESGNNSALYTFGGAAAGVYFNTVERSVVGQPIPDCFVSTGIPALAPGIQKWDPLSRKWSLMAPMQIQRDCCAVVVFDKKIYVAGGASGVTQYKSMDVYNPKTNIWEHVGNATAVGGYCSAAATDKYIFLMNGYPKIWHTERDGTIERYHPKTNTWTIMGSVSPIGFRALVTVGDKILSAGGQNSDNVEEYDPSTGKWKSLANIKYKREIPTMIVANARMANDVEAYLKL